ncbi:MAG TPA: alpha/beta fold hydrolase [Phenylobacterium sp.]
MADTAPLLSIPEFGPPPGGKATWFEGADKARLRQAIFTPKGQARGTVVLSGGRTEVIEKYYEVIAELLERGFVVLTHDWRGQGLSARALPDRLRGHAGKYQEFLSDFDILLNGNETRAPKPWVAMGHSMGGCLTLLALATGQAHRFEAAILSAPMLALNTGPAPRLAVEVLMGLRLGMGGAGDYIGGKPGEPLGGPFEDNHVTHDKDRYARNCALLRAHPDLALGSATWGWLDFAYKAMGFLGQASNLSGVTLPVTICQAGGEKIVDNRGQDRAARALPNAKLVPIAGAFHEILQETDDKRAQFWREFDLLAEGLSKPAPPEKALGEKLVKAVAAAPVETPSKATAKPPAEAPVKSAVVPRKAAAKPQPKAPSKPAAATAKAAAKPAKVAAAAKPVKAAAVPAKPSAAKSKAAASAEAAAKPAARKKAPAKG